MSRINSKAIWKRMIKIKKCANRYRILAIKRYDYLDRLDGQIQDNPDGAGGERERIHRVVDKMQNAKERAWKLDEIHRKYMGVLGNAVARERYGLIKGARLHVVERLPEHLGGLKEYDMTVRGFTCQHPQEHLLIYGKNTTGSTCYFVASANLIEWKVI